jgi:hypothetical protein
MPKKSDIGKLASASTKVQFADQLSSLTKWTADEVKELFPTKSDRDELMELIKIVNSDTDEKAKQAQFAENIGKISGAIIKITKTMIV